MPATEQTWRNTKWMHMVFGLTALVMLLVTLWMFADDHNREWKNHQQTFFQRVEVWDLQARQNEHQGAQYKAAKETRDEELEKQRSVVPDQALIELFALEQRYHHNGSWLEPEDESSDAKPTSATKQSAAPSSGGAPLAVQYASLLNQAQDLLELESRAAAIAVDLDLAKGDAESEAIDQERKAQLQRQVKDLEAALKNKTKELQDARNQISAQVGAFLKTIQEVKGSDSKERYVPSPPAQRVDDSFAKLKETEAEARKILKESDDSEFFRLAHEALHGKAPSASATRQFVEDQSSDKRVKLIRRLVSAKRNDLVELLREQIKSARFEEEKAQLEMKFERANLDVARSDFDLRLGEGAGPSEVVELQRRVDEVTALVREKERTYTSLNRHRKQLDAVLTAASAGETAAQKAIERQTADLKRLEEQRKQSSAAFGKTLLGMPILDAFYNSPQITLKGVDYWLPDLRIDRNFNTVARFDRCKACHAGILKADASDPLRPAYERQDKGKATIVQLSTPQLVRKKDEAALQRGDNDKDLPRRFQSGGSLEKFVPLLTGEKLVVDYYPLVEPRIDDESARQEATKSKYRDYDLTTFVTEVYGFRLAAEGLWRADEPIVEYIVRETPAADAGLKRSDVITEINGAPISTRKEALRSLAGTEKWGQPFTLTLRRGTPHPYSTHPRLELYGTDLSPHPFGKFGCTICHDGQGNGTEFKWASHTPNTLSQAEDWARQHAWFDNLHWIYPMRPKRFAESNCLKCHHDVSELEASDRFPEPPAPNLMEGYHTIRMYGCFGCHEIKGYDGPNKRIGPDLRLEPNYFAAAEQLRYLGFKNQPPKGDNAADRELYEKLLDVRNHPEDSTLRRQLQLMLRQRTLAPAAAAAADVLKDEDAPGKMRKVGPSLRHVASKLDDWFIYNQIENPAGFRPTSRMPQFFGLTEGPHSIFLKDSEGKKADDEAPTKGKSTTKQLEQVEIRAIVEYLREKSQLVNLKATPKSRLAPPKDAKEPLARGKYLFQTRGCLACHQHDAFPDAKENQGPDLSHVGDKLAGKSGGNVERGRTWLYNWLLDPTNYHARTKMPNTFLTPYKEKQQKDGPDVEIDPALEISEFLLASRAGERVAGKDTRWKPAELPNTDTLKTPLRDLAIEHLQGGSGFTKSQALSYLDRGIPAALGPELKGDEVELLQGEQGNFDAARQQLVYLGRRSITKYGCFGCHDVPGFEAAKPIGTGLVDWGRKETSKIAFEQIATYIGKSEPGVEQGAGHELDLSTYPDKNKAFFLNSLVHHQREGFLWQKLREPRSYDYEKTQNKKYNERLKMPRFRFAPDESDGSESTENARIREKVMTFVLGLVSEAPAEKYLYRPEPRRAAINEGRRVLNKYNCGGCHTLEMDQWRISFAPKERSLSVPKTYDKEYPFIPPRVSADVLERSKQQDERGLRHAVVTGTRALDPLTGQPSRQESDIEGKYAIAIELWKPAVINGQAWLAGEAATVLEENAQQLRPPVGGTLSRLLPPVVFRHDQELQRAELPSASMKSPKDALSFVPPPLLNEGRRVQTTWLHNFLLDPHSIRPVVVLRMPRFNMSSDEASALVNYFAAMDGAEYPYAFDARTRQDHLDREQERFPGRLDDAKKFVQTVCLKCHRLGDFVPTPDQAPDLGEVYHRFRPEFLQKWIAHPSFIVPYTNMPENQIPPKAPLDKARFSVPVGPLFDPSASHATSEDQLSAVTDFLLNYDRFTQQHQKEKTEPLKDPAEKEKEKPPEKEKPSPGG